MTDDLAGRLEATIREVAEDYRTATPPHLRDVGCLADKIIEALRRLSQPDTAGKAEAAEIEITAECLNCGTKGSFKVIPRAPADASAGRAAEPEGGIESSVPRSMQRAILSPSPTPVPEVVATNRQQQIMEHDYPTYREFWWKHAMGSKMPPSCLACGHTQPSRETWAITHAELPNIIICKTCRDAASLDMNNGSKS